MSLTGLPLLLSVTAALVLAAAATVRGWRRMPLRLAGLITIEVLTVAGIGLVVNRPGHPGSDHRHSRLPAHLAGR